MAYSPGGEVMARYRDELSLAVVVLLVIIVAALAMAVSR